MIKSKTAVIIGIVEVVAIIALVVFIASLLNATKDTSNSSGVVEIKSKMTIEVVNKMSDEEFVNYAYNAERTDGFLEEKEKEYRDPHYSTNTSSEAIEKIKSRINPPSYWDKFRVGQPDELLDTKLVDETDYYYAIYQKYIQHKGTGDVTYEDTYVVYKKTMFDYDKKTINLKNANTKEKVKRIMDLYIAVNNSQNASFKGFDPTIIEKDNCFEYTYYYFEIVGGDYGLPDGISLRKSTIEIDKKDGKLLEEQVTIIRVARGKLN